MLIITDISRLPDYGFKQNGAHNSNGESIWVLDFYLNDWEDCSLIVNPLHENEVPGECVMTVNVEISRKQFKEDFGKFGRYSREHVLPLDVIADMIADGVLVRVTEKKAVA